METNEVTPTTTAAAPLSRYLPATGGPIAGPIEPPLFSSETSPHHPHHRNPLGLAANSFHVIGTTGLNAALGYAYWLVAAHWFTADAIGVATAAIAAISLASLFASGGLDTWLVQNLPKSDSKDWAAKVGSALAFVGVVGCITGLITALISRPHGTGSAAMGLGITLGLVSIGAATWTMANLIDGAFMADRRADAMLIRNAGFGVGKLIMLIAVAAVGMSRSSVNLTIVWVAATLLSVVCSLTIQFRRLHRSVSFKRHEVAGSVHHMLGTTGWHFLTNMGGRLPMYVLPLIVINRASSTDNAHFYVAWMLGSLFFVVSNGAAGTLLASGAEPGADLSTLTRTSVIFIAKVLPTLAIGSIVFGRFALGLFGPGYSRAGYQMVLVLVAAAIPDGITSIATSLMRLRNQHRQAAALNLSMAAMSCVLAYILVPHWGITGAGAGWAISQTAGSVAVAIVYGIRRSTRKRNTHEGSATQ